MGTSSVCELERQNFNTSLNEMDHGFHTAT